MTKYLKQVVVLICMLSMTSIAYASNVWAENYEADSVWYEEYSFKTTNLGHYKVKIMAKELPRYETLPLDKVPQLRDKFQSANWEGETTVVNSPPTARYGNPLEKLKVDIAFATGALEDFNNFQNYIKTFEGLLKDSRHALDVKVQYVETVTGGFTMEDADASTIYNFWDQYPNPNNFTLNGNFIVNAIFGWNGYLSNSRTNVPFNHFFIESESYDAKDFELNATYCWHGCGVPSGFVFRYNPDKDSAYILLCGTGTWLYKVTNLRQWLGQSTSETGGSTPPNQVYLGNDNALNLSNVTKLATGSSGGWSTSGQGEPISIKVKGNTLTVTKQGQTILNYTDDKLSEPGGIGLFAGCTVAFSDVQLAYDKTSRQTLVQSTTNVNWRDDAYRFIIHATEEVPLEMQPGHDSDYLELITYLMSDNIYLYNIGLDHINKDCFNKLGQALTNSQGEPMSTYIRKSGVGSGIEAAMESTARDIIAKLSRNRTETDWILVNTDVNWRIAEFSDAENDLPLNFGEHDGTSKYNAYDTEELIPKLNSPDIGLGISLTGLRFQGDKVEAERWRFRHFEKFFDNDLGKANYSGVWIADAPTTFDKTGKYRINYQRKDNPFYPNMELSYAFDEYRQWSTNYNDISE